jgi:hypothetical protein
MSLVLNVEILGEFRKLTSATQGAQGELQGLNNKISGFAKSATRAFASIGVGLSFAMVARELGEAAKAAVEDRKSSGLLADQLQKTVGANDALIASVERSISGLSRQAAIADDDLRPAMAQLTRVTGDTDEATKLLKLATDVSAGSGKDLTSVVQALSKAYQGKMTALTKLGIPMSESIQNASNYSKEMVKLGTLQREANLAVETYGEKSKEATKALEKVEAQQAKVNDIAAAGIDWQNDLAEAFGGAAEKAANLDPYQKMKVIFDEMKEQVGTALLPVLDKMSAWLTSPKGEETMQKVTDAVKEMVGWLAATAQWAAENGDWLVPLVTGIASVTAAWKAVTVAVNATKAAIALATAAQVAFNAIAGGTGVGVGGKGKTTIPTTNKAGALVSKAIGIPVLGTIAAILATPGSTQLYGKDAGGTIVRDASGKAIAIRNPDGSYSSATDTATSGSPLKPGVTNNIVINNNTGTVTGSDITGMLNKYSNITGTQ